MELKLFLVELVGLQTKIKIGLISTRLIHKTTPDQGQIKVEMKDKKIFGKRRQNQKEQRNKLMESKKQRCHSFLKAPERKRGRC